MRVRRQQKLCAAPACLAPIAESKFMCGKHWTMLPTDLKNLIAAFCVSQEATDVQKAEALYRIARSAILRAEQGALP